MNLRARRAYNFPRFNSNFSKSRGCFLLHDLKLEVKLFASHDCREVELPELPRKPKRGPALVKIDDELDAESAPEIRQADVSFQRPKLRRSVERKRSVRGHEAGE